MVVVVVVVVELDGSFWGVRILPDWLGVFFVSTSSFFSSFYLLLSPPSALRSEPVTIRRRGLMRRPRNPPFWRIFFRDLMDFVLTSSPSERSWARNALNWEGVRRSLPFIISFAARTSVDTNSLSALEIIERWSERLTVANARRVCSLPRSWVRATMVRVWKTIATRWRVQSFLFRCVDFNRFRGIGRKIVAQHSHLFVSALFQVQS